MQLLSTAPDSTLPIHIPQSLHQDQGTKWIKSWFGFTAFILQFVCSYVKERMAKPVIFLARIPVEPRLISKMGFFFSSLCATYLSCVAYYLLLYLFTVFYKYKKKREKVLKKDSDNTEKRNKSLLKSNFVWMVIYEFVNIIRKEWIERTRVIEALFNETWLEDGQEVCSTDNGI